MGVRAVRGAVQINSDDRAQMLAGVADLLGAVLARNELTPDDLISVIFTATPDLHSEFPAYGVRALGISDVPMLCATELDVADSLPRVIRMLAHVETSRPRADIQHVYLGGATALRPDLAP
ncbi:MAG: chorismate mutase [Actinomycetota bacterium]|nr:chorismate mutase [Actinomycetota bacterium]